MVVLATLATVIASQAVITGAYSITHQAIQLGLLPRLEIRHTSAALYGQIYMPRVNILLLVGVLLLVGLFRTSSDLAGAYVLAVAATSLMATLLAFVVIWKMWRWKIWSAVLLISPFVDHRRQLPDRRADQAARGRLAAGGCSAASSC